MRPARLALSCLAFGGDPIARWCWPDSHQYLTSMPGFTWAFGGGAFAHESAFCTEDFGGAALWLPPHVHPDEAALGDIVIRPCRATRGELLTMLDQMAAYHPDEPHWYLPLIGVVSRTSG